MYKCVKVFTVCQLKGNSKLQSLGCVPNAGFTNIPWKFYITVLKIRKTKIYTLNFEELFLVSQP